MRAALDITPKGGGTFGQRRRYYWGERHRRREIGLGVIFCGKRAAMPQITEGIALFDHPQNPWAPTPWFYPGTMALLRRPRSISMIKPWTIAAGKRVTFRYAVLLHSGDPVAADLAGPL